MIRFLTVLTFGLLLASCGRDMQTLESGIQYQILSSSDTGRLTKKGDILFVDMIMKTQLVDSLGGGDTFVFNTFKTQKPFYIPSEDPNLGQVFTLLRKGDSVYFEVDADSLYNKSFGMPVPAVFHKDAMVQFTVKVVDIFTQEELEKINQQKMREVAVKDSLDAAAYIATLQNVQTTTSGLKYVIVNPGKGAFVKDGDEVVAAYKGMFLDGKVFDQRDESNPLTFMQGGMIPGWNEGLLLMKEGAEFKFIIPYYLGYGDRGYADIPPYSTLVFDVKIIKTGKPKPGAPGTTEPKLQLK